MSALPDSATFTVHGPADGEPPMLSALEWKVVAIALKEAGRHGRRVVAPSSAIGRMLRRVLDRITGARGTLPLADPRLETLRRFVCLSRWGDQGADELAHDLVAQGFTQGQVRAVAMLVGR